MDVARLIVAIEGNTAGADAAFAKTQAGMNAIVLGSALMGAAVVGAGILAVKAAGDFQQGLTSLVTGAGLASKDVGKVHDAILQMAQDTGTSTKQLVDGMYMISSAGFPAAQALDILKASAEGAKVGNADLGIVADATTTILKDYPNTMNGAAGAVNALVATVANGKTHMQDLAQSLAMILPTASAAGVSLFDVMGAMATMTGEGVPAANAATYLRQTILSLVAPGGAAKKTLDDIGLSSKQVADSLKTQGLPATLQLITDHLKNKFPVGSAAYVAALKDIAGGSKTMQGMLDLTGTHLKDFGANVNKVGGASVASGQKIQGWSDVQKDLNFQVSVAKSMVEAAFISIGEKLLPKVTEFIQFLTVHAKPAIQGFTQWLQDHKAIVIITAAVVGGILVTAFTMWAASALAAGIATLIAMAPVIAIGAAIGLLAAGVIYAYTHWGWFKTVIDGVLPGLGKMKDALGQVFDFLGKVKDRIGDLLGQLGKLKDLLGSGLGIVGNAVSGIHLPGFASGTQYTAGGAFAGAEHGPELLLTPGVYTAPRGSTVVDAQDTAKILKGSGGGVTNNYNIYPAKAEFGPEDMVRLQRRHALLASTSAGY